MAIEMAPPLTPEREMRGPGCTALCRVVAAIVSGQFGRTELLLHDARSHEAFGRSQVVTRGLGTHDIATGPLLIRPLARKVYVNGEGVYLTAKEWAIVDVLARNIGGLVTNAHILFTAWGEAYWNECHLLRVNIARIRTKLGAAKPLIETRFGQGYVLRLVEYTGPTP